MPPLPQIRISMVLKGDALGLQLQRKFRSVARQTPAYADRIVNKACNSISFKAANNMPVATMANIDRELEVASSGVTKTGNLSRAKNPRWRKVSFVPPSVAGYFVNSEDKLWSGFYQASLAIRITLSRFYSRSRYNVTTGQVYALQKPGTHGQGQFWQWVYNTTERMVKARHSAIAFYKACAVAVNKGFGVALGKVSVFGSNVDVNQAVRLLARGLAKIEPSKNGAGRAKFSVSDTEPDTKGRAGADFAKKALPVWQRAVDEETASIKQEVHRRLAENLRMNGLIVPL
jgi:hypothetical protein